MSRKATKRIVTRHAPRSAPSARDWFSRLTKKATLTQLRSELARRAPDDWFSRDEACVYLGLSRGALALRVFRGELVADGRGARRSPEFRKRTLDAHIEARA